MLVAALNNKTWEGKRMSGHPRRRSPPLSHISCETSSIYEPLDPLGSKFWFTARKNIQLRIKMQEEDKTSYIVWSLTAVERTENKCSYSVKTALDWVWQIFFGYRLILSEQHYEKTNWKNNFSLLLDTTVCSEGYWKPPEGIMGMSAFLKSLTVEEVLLHVPNFLVLGLWCHCVKYCQGLYRSSRVCGCSTACI